MNLPDSKIVDALLLIIALVFSLTMLCLSAFSLYEREKTAAGRALLLALTLPLPYLIIFTIEFELRATLGWVVVALTLSGLILLFIPAAKGVSAPITVPKKRIDERDTMFSRRDLPVDSDRFKNYYRLFPEKLLPDNRFRELPGLLRAGSTYFDPALFACAEAAFDTVGHFHNIVDGQAAPKRISVSKGEMTAFVRKWAIKLGARDVGVTELRDYHLYSHKGRGSRYGEVIEKKYRYAVAFTVEMDREMIASAPAAPTVVESSLQYLNSGTIAVQTANFFRRLGYAARAHIDGDYEVVCPLVARDAGLGDIGRMGLLMTPRLGPRVRISVVTTDLPLEPVKSRGDVSLIDFCRRCKKCARVCPSQAIPYDDERDIEGTKRWQIDSEACFTFWCSAGTDCARCITVCPYSHPDRLIHNLVRRGIRYFPLFRRFSVLMDDALYGNKPVPSDVPDWMNISVIKQNES